MGSSYKHLKVWQRSMDVAVDIYEISKTFPKEEMYGLTSQMRRSAVSISSNIAEGNGRDSIKEYLRFISIAFGSLAELETQIILAERIGLLIDSDKLKLFDKVNELGKMLYGLQKSLREKQTPNLKNLHPVT